MPTEALTPIRPLFVTVAALLLSTPYSVPSMVPPDWLVTEPPAFSATPELPAPVA